MTRAALRYAGFGEFTSGSISTSLLFKDVEGATVIILGIVLVLLALFLEVPPIIMTIGIILIIVGAVLAVLGGLNRAVGPRRHYW